MTKVAAQEAARLRCQKRSRVRIRPATIGDLDFVRSLVPRFVEAGLPPWRERDDVVSGTFAQLRAALEKRSKNSFFAIAENDEGVRQGFAWAVILADFYTGEPIGKISEIAVARNGGGIGRALMNACESFARSRGARLMTLNLLETNENARAFYRSCGYLPEYSMFAKPLVVSEGADAER